MWNLRCNNTFSYVTKNYSRGWRQSMQMRITAQNKHVHTCIVLYYCLCSKAFLVLLFLCHLWFKTLCWWRDWALAQLKVPNNSWAFGSVAFWIQKYQTEMLLSLNKVGPDCSGFSGIKTQQKEETRLWFTGIQYVICQVALRTSAEEAALLIGFMVC